MLVYDLHDLVPPQSYIFLNDKTGFTVTLIVLKILVMYNEKQIQQLHVSNSGIISIGLS